MNARYIRLTIVHVRDYLFLGSFSLPLSGSFFVDRVSRDENRITRIKIVKCQPRKCSHSSYRQGKHESKKEKVSRLLPILRQLRGKLFRASTLYRFLRFVLPQAAIWFRRKFPFEFALVETLPRFTGFPRGKLDHSEKILIQEIKVKRKEGCAEERRVDRFDKLYVLIKWNVRHVEYILGNKEENKVLFAISSSIDALSWDGAFLVIFSPFHRHPRS